jgi:hypothetical protein
MTIGGYSINGHFINKYWCLFDSWLLMAIGGYSIGGYWWLF